MIIIGQDTWFPLIQNDSDENSYFKNKTKRNLVIKGIWSMSVDRGNKYFSLEKILIHQKTDPLVWDPVSPQTKDLPLVFTIGLLMKQNTLY